MKLDLRHTVTINEIDATLKPRTDARVKDVWKLTGTYLEAIDAEKGEDKLNQLRHEYYADLWALLLESEEKPEFASEHFEYDMLIGLRDFFLGLRKI